MWIHIFQRNKIRICYREEVLNSKVCIFGALNRVYIYTVQTGMLKFVLITMGFARIIKNVYSLNDMPSPPSSTDCASICTPLARRLSPSKIGVTRYRT